MENGQLTWITNFIWGIADDVLRDLYVRGKYRDVILPMTVIRRLDAVLEPTKQAVLDMKASLDKAGITNQDAALRRAAGQAFYNTSPFTLRDLKTRASRQQLEADFRAYLDGFSPNVQEIIDNFEFRNQIPRLAKADALGTLIEKFLDPSINLSPQPVLGSDGSVRLPGLDNHAMGTIFEELVRRFNEENNEEAGEHWTPRDAVRLMAHLVFEPIADRIESGTYLLYDGACGTGGMLTVAEETLLQLAKERGKQVSVHLFGQEINAETYAICKADLLLKGEGDAADNIVGGPEHSTLSNDAFPGHEFDFMLSNPPYGKSWKSDMERMGGKAGIKDPRFVVQHRGEELSLITRSSDGQMMFLVNMLSKMKHDTPLGSRIAEVHNGSSLFTGDAGQGESNIRRWIIENDWLEAIVALPLNMFYNTGIATYVWVLTNRKPGHRKGRVQLIDATQWYKPLRKNLGKKNCELSEEDIRRVLDTFLKFEETEQSKIFPNAAFGYWKVTVERPLRLKGIDPERAYTAKEIRALRNTAERAEDAPAVIKKIHKPGTAPDPLHGLFEVVIGGKPRVVEYEPDTELRDSEQIPFLECPACHEPGYLPGPEDQRAAIETFLRREVLPYAPDAWYDPESVKVGYEINFNRYFYKPKALRTLEEIRTDLLAVEKEAEGWLEEILGGEQVEHDSTI
jgi:type I restriction enzyme M protein